MYSVRYLPVARRDLVDIASYIANALGNSRAASDTASGIVNAISSLTTMPYRRRVYQTVHPLRHEYRCIGYENYLAFYWIDEDNKAIVVARILYAKSSIAQKLG